MFWLHFLDGGRNHRGSVIAVTESDIPPVVEINIGGSKLIDITSGKSETLDIGWRLGPVQAKNNAVKLAYVIAREYNYDVMIDGKVAELPYDAGRAAATLGAIKSEAKARASRANGRKGGRPRKVQ